MLDIAYTDMGQGGPVVLIHGFCETKEIWADFQKALSGSHRVVCPDLPGFGESPLPKTSFDLEYIASKLYDWMKAIGLRSPTVIGHSLGGYVALALAKKAGDELHALGLFHSTAFADSEEKKESRNKTIAFLEKNGTKPFVKSFIPQLFAFPQLEQHKARIDGLVDIGLKIPVDTLIAYTKAMRDRKDHMDVLQAFPGKKFLIAGRLDPAIPIEASSAHKVVVDEYLELPDAAHMGMFEVETDTLTFIRRFLQPPVPHPDDPS
ncbi:alpha/beta fold hydrolase [Negadavirga shengliensis]|uniref:Alpha/beta fold hydrolase n=1 Tax=Negadavirga shengliensis TaxID=1389218 RepID=A0ABV9SVU2_9BACT